MKGRDWGLVLLMALALKQGYAMADTMQLQWLLWPLARLLDSLFGLPFQAQAGGEWLDAEHGLVIVKACAGGNFLLASWLGWLWRWRLRPLGAVLLGQALAAAWLATLLANAMRILAIAHGQDALADAAGLSDDDSHRLIGIAVYFGALSLQMVGRGALPVAAALYLGVTLLVPAARAWLLGLEGIDSGHAAWTAGVPLAVLLAYWGIRTRPGRIRERRSGRQG